MSNFLEKASDKNQYNNLDWKNSMSVNSPWRKFLLRNIERLNLDLEGKKVLDIGSGIGEMSEFYKQEKCLYCEGVEPSIKQVQISKKLFPDFRVSHNTIEGFSSNEKYDAIFMLFVFEHINDLEKAFEKVSSLLKMGGKLVITHVDFHYKTQQIHKGVIKFYDIQKDLIVTQDHRAAGIMYDIIRSSDVLINIARHSGLCLTKHEKIIPDEAYIRERPKYKKNKGAAIANILVLEKRYEN